MSSKQSWYFAPTRWLTRRRMDRMLRMQREVILQNLRTRAPVVLPEPSTCPACGADLTLGDPPE